MATRTNEEELQYLRSLSAEDKRNLLKSSKMRNEARVFKNKQMSEDISKMGDKSEFKEINNKVANEDTLYGKQINERFGNLYDQNKQASDKAAKTIRDAGEEASKLVKDTNIDYSAGLNEASESYKANQKELTENIGNRRAQAQANLRGTEEAIGLEAQIQAAKAGRTGRVSLSQMRKVSQGVTERFLTSLNKSRTDLNNFELQLDDKLSQLNITTADKNLYIEGLKKGMRQEEIQPIIDAIAGEAKSKVEFDKMYEAVKSGFLKGDIDEITPEYRKEQRFRDEDEMWKTANDTQKNNLLESKFADLVFFNGDQIDKLRAAALANTNGAQMLSRLRRITNIDKTKLALLGTALSNAGEASEALSNNLIAYITGDDTYSLGSLLGDASNITVNKTTTGGTTNTGGATNITTEPSGTPADLSEMTDEQINSIMETMITEAYNNPNLDATAQQTKAEALDDLSKEMNTLYSQYAMKNDLEGLSSKLIEQGHSEEIVNETLTKFIKEPEVPTPRKYTADLNVTEHRRNYQAMDTNKDGHVTKEEQDNWRKVGEEAQKESDAIRNQDTNNNKENTTKFEEAFNILNNNRHTYFDDDHINDFEGIDKTLLIESYQKAVDIVSKGEVFLGMNADDVYKDILSLEKNHPNTLLYFNRFLDREKTLYDQAWGKFTTDFAERDDVKKDPKIIRAWFDSQYGNDSEKRREFLLNPDKALGHFNNQIREDSTLEKFIDTKTLEQGGLETELSGFNNVDRVQHEGSTEASVKYLEARNLAKRAIVDKTPEATAKFIEHMSDTFLVKPEKRGDFEILKEQFRNKYSTLEKEDKLRYDQLKVALYLRMLGESDSRYSTDPNVTENQYYLMK